ncbi:MAG: YceI family protein [Flammeovirgaceae bacterium]|nr:MAG: YceI family protein [Flammeovirgaceae bacterium]
MRCLSTLSFTVFFLVAKAQVYVPVDALSKIDFKIKNFGSTVDGSFKGLKGTINFDPAQLSSAAFDVTINAATIDTGIGMRDNHLRKSDYFNVKEYPTIRFVSGKVEQSTKPNVAIITGKLTIKKTTKEISFPFRYSYAGDLLQLTGEFRINRREFGVGGSSISLADELTVLLDVRATKQLK